MDITARECEQVQNRRSHEEVMLPPPTPGKVSPELLQALDAIKSVQRFSKGATLFHEGSAATGVYLVEGGEVRILLPDGQNEKQVLEVVDT